jgi:hypothetical protein
LYSSFSKSMKPRLLVIPTLAFLIAANSEVLPGPKPQKPNALMVAVDDLNDYFTEQKNNKVNSSPNNRYGKIHQSLYKALEEKIIDY